MINQKSEFGACMPAKESKLGNFYSLSVIWASKMQISSSSLRLCLTLSLKSFLSLLFFSFTPLYPFFILLSFKLYNIKFILALISYHPDSIAFCFFLCCTTLKLYPFLLKSSNQKNLFIFQNFPELTAALSSFILACPHRNILLEHHEDRRWVPRAWEVNLKVMMMRR